jgi:hypothetical protein
MRILFGDKARRKVTLQTPRRRWEDTIKMDLREIGYDGMDWIDMAPERGQWRTQ